MFLLLVVVELGFFFFFGGVWFFVGKSSPCGGNRFSLSLSERSFTIQPYLKNVLSVLLIKHLLPIHLRLKYFCLGTHVI